MKYVVLLYDGMADYPVPALGGKTPMELAKKPLLDTLASKGEVGLVKTVGDGLKPGSDIANMSVLGYNPAENYTGRSPLEAVSIGAEILDTDIVFRCNTVTLSDESDYEKKRMIDYSAGDISTEDSEQIIETVQEHFGNDVFKFYNGVSYRHCLIQHGGTLDLGELTPPHDITGKVISPYLSKNKNAAELIEMMRESYSLLKAHPVNLMRIREGKRPANSIWLWGEGTKPSLPLFYDKYGLKASIISAVDLLKGIAKCAGMNAPDVEGATGYLDTNFEGKAHKALDELKNGCDLVYIHIEAPDECGHRNEPENKVRSIELIDERVLKILIEGLENYDDYKIMALPDHPTPIVTLTHARDPVPYMIYHKKGESDNKIKSFTEKTAAETGVFIEHGHTLMAHFIKEEAIQ